MAPVPDGATGLLIGGRWCASGTELTVIDKYTREPFAAVQQARPSDVEAAVRSQVWYRTGFTPADADTEITRAVATMRLSAEESVRIAGEEVPVAAAPGSEGRLAFTIRVPVGVVAAIAPFNAPLNTVAHKVGPALAAGNAVVLKPATLTPLTVLKLAAHAK